MKEQRFPPGWDDDRVKRLIAHYDSLTEEEQVAEDEAARRRKGMEDQSISVTYDELWRRVDNRNG